MSLVRRSEDFTLINIVNANGVKNLRLGLEHFRQANFEISDFHLWTSPGGGPSLWLEVPKRISIPKIVAELDEQKIIIQPSDDAFRGTPHLHGFKVGYAYLTKKEMQKGLEI